jgi:hypothetical protein
MAVPRVFDPPAKFCDPSGIRVQALGLNAEDRNGYADRSGAACEGWMAVPRVFDRG